MALVNLERGFSIDGLLPSFGSFGQPDPLTNMAAIGNSCFWLVDFQKSFPLKPLGQINRNL
jgi:hypothetical protein